MTQANPQDRPADRESSDTTDGIGGLVRRVLTPGPSSEERLEQLLAERRRELDEHAARFDESIADLERREELLRDSRASVERMLRLRTSDLEARENELTDFLRDLTERETRLASQEADLARRRGELGAVELRRAAVEQRDRAVSAREERLAELDAQYEAGATPAPEQGVRLAFVPGRTYRLFEIEVSALAVGDALELEGRGYVVARIGRSPLPGDGRRCAYVLAGPRGESSSGSS
ncbi:MAG: hypothetical protein ACRDOF_04305 [Gaiellaceae bacterium]